VREFLAPLFFVWAYGIAPAVAKIEIITTEEKAGRQYRVVPDDVLEIGKIAGDVGTIVQLGEVLLIGGDAPVLGVPTVAGASVAAEVLQHKRGPKVISFKKRRRKNSKRKRGYRDEITVLRITEILTNDNKPSIGPRPKREKVAAAEPAEASED